MTRSRATCASHGGSSRPRGSPRGSRAARRGRSRNPFRHTYGAARPFPFTRRATSRRGGCARTPRT
jgi:hypothetical protein